MANRILVTSSNINSIGYDISKKTLEIEFKTGKIYFYYTVDEDTYLDLIMSASKGKYYNKHIKGLFPSEMKI